MSNGRVIIGYSNPVYGLYDFSTGAIDTVSPFARGIDISITPNGSEILSYYANNGVAEMLGSPMTSADLSLTVDGLKHSVVSDIYNVNDFSTENFAEFTTDTGSTSFCFGFIITTMEGGNTRYVPVILPNVVLKLETLQASTKGESVEFTTEQITGTVLPLASSKVWKYVGQEQTTLGSYDSETHTGTGAIGQLISKMRTITWG